MLISSNPGAVPVLFSNRNRLINGAMRIDQRNSGAAQTITSTAAYTVDRWYSNASGANVTGQRVAGSGGFQYAYQFTGAASNTSVVLAQRIESINIADLASTTVTLSAYLASSTLTTVNWALYSANSTDNFGSSTLISSGSWTITSTLTRYQVAVTLSSAAANGVALNLSTGAFTSGTLTITGVQLETGSAATLYEQPNITTELMACQRYLPAFIATSTTFPLPGTGTTTSTTNAQVLVVFPVTARAIPTGVYVNNATYFSVTIFIGATAASVIALASILSTQAALLTITTSGSTSSLPCALYATNASAVLYFTGCEL